MKLEDEIQTKRFMSNRHKLNVNILYTSNWLTNHHQPTFKARGLTLQQFNILRILRGQFPNASTIQLLKERMMDKQSDVSRLVDRLCKKGLVERTVCKNDRRKMDVLISQAGLDLLAQMDPEIENLNDVFKELTTEEVDQLNSLLDKLRG